jgi:bifunctional non-homologous end joining protein LigD
VASRGPKRNITKPAVPGSKLGPLPGFVAPSLALRADEAPSGEAWLHEIKFDGYRLEARVENGQVTLLTRNRIDWTARFEAVAEALATLKVETALLDGEIVVEDEDGLSSFSELVADLKAGRSSRMVYYAFDILHLDGIDLRGAALIDRKAVLARLLKGRRGGKVRLSGHVEGDGDVVMDKACELGLEGIISKRADKPYRSGRSCDWIKSACELSDEFVIGGYLDSSVYPEEVGALALGAYDRGRLVYVGRVGTGFTRRTASDVWRAAQPLRTSSSPFVDGLDAKQRRGVRWLRPELVAQVQYRAWTGDGILRHASFKGLREDKPVRMIRRPRAKA